MTMPWRDNSAWWVASSVQKKSAELVCSIKKNTSRYVRLKRSVQKLQGCIPDSAIIDDAGRQLRSHRVIISALGIVFGIAGADREEKGFFMLELLAAVGPAIAPDPVDPAFGGRRQRPSPYRENKSQGVCVFDTRLLGKNGDLATLRCNPELEPSHMSIAYHSNDRRPAVGAVIETSKEMFERLNWLKKYHYS
jgi:hypothetical protein